MKNCVITPTFAGHFKYIVDYLKSFSEFATDKDNFEICFTISKSEKHAFDKIIVPFKDLNIKVLLFEDILKKFKVSYTPNELLTKYEKFSFQTLKKFYTMLYLGADYRFLILDSESILFNKCNVGELFNNFFEHPFISYSDIDKREQTSNFMHDVKANTAFVLKSSKVQKLWFLENFVWFYDYKILNDMFKIYGSPFKIINNVYRTAQGHRNIAVFEIDLYHSFIYLHHNKYKYNVIDSDTVLSRVPDMETYKKTKYATYGGDTGLLEHAMQFLTKDNIKPLATEFKNNNFNIIRCNETTIKNYKLQRHFLDIAKPDILAASQDHLFGVKDAFINRVHMAANCANFRKIQSHVDLFVRPIGHFLQWLYQPIYLLFALVKFIISFIINICSLINK